MFIGIYRGVIEKMNIKQDFERFIHSNESASYIAWLKKIVLDAARERGDEQKQDADVDAVNIDMSELAGYLTHVAIWIDDALSDFDDYVQKVEDVSEAEAYIAINEFLDNNIDVVNAVTENIIDESYNEIKSIEKECEEERKELVEEHEYNKKHRFDGIE